MKSYASGHIGIVAQVRQAAAPPPQAKLYLAGLKGPRLKIGIKWDVSGAWMWGKGEWSCSASSQVSQQKIKTMHVTDVCPEFCPCGLSTAITPIQD